MAAHRAGPAGEDDGDHDEAVEVTDDFAEPDLGEDEGADDADIVPRVDTPEQRPTRRLVEGLVAGVRPGANGRHDLTGDDVHKLQTTLAELLECKRLLDQVR